MWTRLSWRLSIVARLGTPSERVERIILGSFKKTNSFRSLVDRDESFILVSSCENENSPTRMRRMRGVQIPKTIGRARRIDLSVERYYAGEMCIWRPLRNLSNTAVRSRSDKNILLRAYTFGMDLEPNITVAGMIPPVWLITSWQHTTSVHPSKRMLPVPNMELVVRQSYLRRLHERTAYQGDRKH